MDIMGRQWWCLMIKITAELWPLGSEKHKVHLGTAEIANLGTGTKARGNYRYRLSRKGAPDSTWKEGEVYGFPRKRLNMWYLLLWVLGNAINVPDRLKKSDPRRKKG